jgi:oxalate decarboxylase/phosphoglucose isomerase-like protein (cupin superfamily)
VIHDVSRIAGFSLLIDDSSLTVRAGDGFDFAEHPHYIRDLRLVLETPDAAPSDREVYRTYLPRALPPGPAALLDKLGLAFSLVAVRPLLVGREFAKTRGHLHALIPGTQLTSPEVYAQLHGCLTVLLQRSSTRDPEAVDDFVVGHLVAGSVLVVPPGYAHALVNSHNQLGLLAGLYADPVHAPPRYEPIEHHGGFAYRIVADGPQEWRYERNSRYSSAAEPRILPPNPVGPFRAPAPGEALWTTFVRSPAMYEFLARASAAEARFTSEQTEAGGG